MPQPSSRLSAAPAPASQGPPDILWARQFGTEAGDNAQGLAIDVAGNLYVVGDTLGILPGQISSGRRDAYLRKYDGDGSEAWTRQFGTRGDDTGLAVAVDERGGLYVSGITWDAFPGYTNAGENDTYLSKYDVNGNELWTRQFGTDGEDEVRGIGLDSAGNVYLMGQTRLYISGFSNLQGVGEDYTPKSNFLNKYDSQGNELWARRFPTKMVEKAFDVAVDGPGTVYVVGSTGLALPTQGHLEGRDAFVRTYGSNGDESWSRQFGIQDVDRASGVTIGGTGKVYVAGSTEGAFPGHRSMGHRDAFLSWYDETGTELRTIQFGTEADDAGLDLEMDGGGNLYVLGSTGGSFPGQANFGEEDAYLRKYNDDGNELWTLQFGTRLDDVAAAIALDGAGHLYVAGSTSGPFAGQVAPGITDAFVVKIATGSSSAVSGGP